MGKDRRAYAVTFGFDFQVNSAIVLMLENIINLKSLKLEGNNEDIEIELNNGKYILAQAKAIKKGSTDFSNVRANLKKALETLSEGSQKVKVEKLIFITNSFNPLNDKASQGIFAGPPAHRPYDTLPESSQKIIDGYLDKIRTPLDKNDFWIQTIPFETDDDNEKYKNIRRVVDDFIGDLQLNILGIEKQVLSLWQNEVFKNSTREDADIKLSKKDLIWPMLVIATDIERCDEEFLSCFEQDIYEEIVHLYKETIDSCCEKYEFFIKVLCDYNNYKSVGNLSEKCADFAINKWSDYINEFAVPGIEADVQEALIKIVLYNIVKKRRTINRIKQGVNL